MRTASVFVIHPEKDNKILQKLVCEYQDQTFGSTTLKIRFVDSGKASQLGHDFGDMIKDKIGKSDFIIAIVSPNSKKSIWVNQEIGFALGKGVHVVPLKSKSMASKGLGFIHSNIDSQILKPRQKRFLKLDRFFEKKFGSKSARLLGPSIVAKPVDEGKKVPLRRAGPSVVG
jgi:hypothetical protein